MSKDTGQKRVAIMVGAGYIPGINAVVAGASLAAGKLGWSWWAYSMDLKVSSIPKNTQMAD